jgi:hypothetical protein
MPNFYSRHLTKSLAEVLREALDQNPQEQLQLYEELALLRDLAGQSVAYYAIAKDNFANANSETDANNKRGILFAAGELMRDHLNDVVKVCDTAAKVAAQGKDTVMLSQLHYFVEQVTRCAYEAFGDDPRREKFKQMLEAKVRLPQVDVNGNGTRLTPDMDALAMDSTVPKDNSVIDIELVDSFYKRKEDNVSPSTNGE